MDVTLDFKLLAKFLAACQNVKLSDAAVGQGVTTSTMSAALRTLEERLDVQLFQRQGGMLALLPAAFGLFRDACALLHLEEQARRMAASGHTRFERLTVRIDLSFAIGKFTKALERTIQTVGANYPTLFIECQFRQEGETISSKFFDEIPEARSGVIDIFYEHTSDAIEEERYGTLVEDPWVIVGSSHSETPLDVGRDALVLLRMKPALMRAGVQYASQIGVGHRLELSDALPADLSQLLLQRPNQHFLLPERMLSTRLGLSDIRAKRLDPPLVSVIRAQESGNLADRSALFLKTLKTYLDGPEENVVFQPEITMRQFQLLNLAVQTGSISSAARAAHVAQPVVSSHLRKLEEAAGASLLNRQKNGVRTTSAGRVVAQISREIELSHMAFIARSHDVATYSQDRVTIGTLPSSGHDSVLTNRIAAALSDVLADHPLWHLQLFEASNELLHEKVRNGDMNLAIVGHVGQRVGRIALGEGEPLAVVAHPSIELPGSAKISLAAASSLPMALGPAHLSIHQSFVDVMRSHGHSIQTAVYVGSLAFAIALVKKAPICTVLPLSSVEADVEAGRLNARIIDDPLVSGQLHLIFSLDRVLSDSERLISKALTETFRGLRPKQVAGRSN